MPASPGISPTATASSKATESQQEEPGEGGGAQGLLRTPSGHSGAAVAVASAEKYRPLQISSFFFFLSWIFPFTFLPFILNIVLCIFLLPLMLSLWNYHFSYLEYCPFCLVLKSFVNPPTLPHQLPCSTWPSYWFPSLFFPLSFPPCPSAMSWSVGFLIPEWLGQTTPGRGGGILTAQHTPSFPSFILSLSSCFLYSLISPLLTFLIRTFLPSFRFLPSSIYLLPSSSFNSLSLPF